MGSMYGIFTYIWLIFMVNVGKYTFRPMDPSWAIHGSYGLGTFLTPFFHDLFRLTPRI